MAEQDSNTNLKNVRRMSADSGAPSSHTDDNLREDTELKQPLNRNVMSVRSEKVLSGGRQPQHRNFTRQRGGHVSDASSMTSQFPQSSDTEVENKTVISHLENIIGKRASKKGKCESPYIHIGKIIINNNPKPDPMYYDHPPPAPCANNYTYINDGVKEGAEEEVSEYYNVSNMGREATEQGSTPRGVSPSFSLGELHAIEKIDPYKMTTENFVTGGREDTKTTPKTNIHVEKSNGSGYGFLMRNPTLNIAGLDLNGKVEITLKTHGPEQKTWKGELTPQTTTAEIVQESLEIFPKPETREHADATIAAEKRQHQSSAVSTPTLNVVHDAKALSQAQSAPQLTQNTNIKVASTSDNSSARQQIYSSANPLGLLKTPEPSVKGKGCFSEQNIVRCSKPKGLFRKEVDNTPCPPSGFYNIKNENEIAWIKKCLVEQGKDCMWFISFLSNNPGHPYSLHIRKNSQVYSFPVSQDMKRKLSIDTKSRTFPCICKLVTYYRKHKLPHIQVNLGVQPFLVEYHTRTSNITGDEKLKNATECSDTRL